MSIYQQEGLLITHMDSAFESFDHYLKTEPFTDNYREFHKSIQLIKRDDEQIEFKFLGKHFIMLKELRITRGFGLIKTYLKEADMEDYPKVKCTEIPVLTLNVSWIGNITYESDSSLAERFGETYFTRLIAYITAVEAV